MIFVLVGGVSGTGKSTLGQALASKFHAELIEGDDYHTAENLRKMSSGIPLSDDDRWPWLKSLSAAVVEHALDGKIIFIACSCLKQSYRKYLTDAFETTTGNRTVFLCLHVDSSTQSVIERRMGQRKGHFMAAGMLKSQLETYQVPGGGVAGSAGTEGSLHYLLLDASQTLDVNVEQSTEYLEKFLKE